MFIDRLEIDKEKIIIGWDDLCSSAVWIYDNWSWGFFIAILSLWFTAKALKKTDRANQLAGESLELTKQSTDIADQSLKATQKSIDIALDIAETERKNAYDEKKSKFKAIRILILDEIKYVHRELIQISGRFDSLEKHASDPFEIQIINDSINIFIEIGDRKTLFIDFNLITNDLDKYTLILAVLDLKSTMALTDVIMELKHYNDGIKPLLEESNIVNAQMIDLINNIRILKIQTEGFLEKINILNDALKNSTLN